MSKEMIFYRLSEKFGWTPNEIRQMSADDINTYMGIFTVQNK